MARSGGKPKGRLHLPLAILISYGPDDKTVSKIVVSIYVDPERPATVVKKWFGTGADSDPQVDGEIRQFLRTHRAKTLAIQPGVFGCPHEEGMDFPEGGDCPHCPFWAGKQGSGAAVEERWATLEQPKIRHIDLRMPGVRWSLRG